MTAPGGAQSARAWDITISCPRPNPRVSKSRQAWHLKPERIARDCVMFFGPRASIKLTTRTATLRYPCSGSRLGNLPEVLQERFACVLQGLYFDIEMPRTGEYLLPRPVRMTITEHADAEQTSRTEGDQMT